MQTIEDLEENRIVNVSVRVLLVGPIILKYNNNGVNEIKAILGGE